MREIETDWNVASRSVVTGLQFLHMSADKDWIVRHDLSIDLDSSGYAQQRYEVDVDMNELIDRTPPRLAGASLNRIWAPILRIPSARPADQRIRTALGAGQQAVPVMPQNEVRRYLASALTWLILNRFGADLSRRTSSEKALIRNELRRRLRTFIRTGDRSLFDSMREETAIESELWNELKRLVAPDQNYDSDQYWAGVAECIRYCRLNYFVVAGIDRSETAPHISCELLPPELLINKYHQFGAAHELIGFSGATDDGQLGYLRKILTLPQIAYSLATGPSSYHLNIPVPEIADLRAVHVQLTVPDDVCAEPAVLHHDSRIRIDDDRLVIQSRCRGGAVTLSPLEVLEEDLKKKGPISTVEAGALVAAELDDIAKEWNYRADRLEMVERLSGTADQPSFLKRMLRFPTPRAAHFAPTALRQKALELRDETEALSHQITDRVANSANPDELHRIAAAGLESLIETERSIPHVEMTADDDRREHVAHFHVDSTRTVHERTTDSRPAIHAIIRPSRLGRNDYVGTASLSCLTSTLLLIGLFLLNLAWPQRTPNVEALVALLLLVPGLSVSLLGRISGETMRYLVLGRAQRLASLSLIPPVVSAGVLAALLDQPAALAASLDLPWFLPDLTIRNLFATTALASALITALVVRDRFRGGGPFAFDTPVLGLITYPNGQHDDQIIEQSPVEDGDQVTATAVNTDRVVELIEPALFQIARPSQRFMVAVVLGEDKPNVFRQVIDVLESLPQYLASSENIDEGASGRTSKSLRRVMRDVFGQDDEPQGENSRNPTIIESSLVMSVATTGVTMSIVSHDLGAGAQGSIDEHQISDLLNDELRGRGANAQVIVQEIVDDTRYFRYRAFEYQHYAFKGNDQYGKVRRHDLLTDLIALQKPWRRISYLYCPIRAKPVDGKSLGKPGEDAAVRVGFAVTRDNPDPSDHLKLRLTAAAQRSGYQMETDRSVADGPGVGLGYRWSAANDLEPKVLFSAGPDDKDGLQNAIDILGKHGEVVFEGGTVLTDRSYTCRTFRFWASKERHDEIARTIGTNGRGAIADSDPTHWLLLPSDVKDPIAKPASESNPQWVITWIRWRLEVGPERGVAYLLSVLEQWAEATNEQTDWSITFNNIEFLANRLHGRQLVSGKARYRLGVKLHREDIDLEIDDVIEDINRSLETFLRVGLKGLLTSARHYVVVDRMEPKNPLTVSVESK